MLRVTGDVRISAAVMTHPERMGRAVLLRERCGDLGPRIVVDPDPGGCPSAWRTARAAWRSVHPEATHHLVIQDDAQLADGFVPALAAAVQARPLDALALFAEWGSRTAGAVRLAAAMGAAWAECADDYIPCVAIVLPFAEAVAFDAYAEKHSSEVDPDDVVLLRFLAERSVRALTPVEGLVDHDQCESLVGNKIMGLRRAVRYQDAWSGLSDSTVCETPSAIPYYDWWDQQAVAFVPDAGSPDGWARLRSASAFEFLGADVSVADMSFDERQDALSERLRDLVSTIILREIWKTAFMFGFVIADQFGAPGLSANERFVEAAATLAPGGLRRIVPVHLLSEISSLLLPFVLAGVEAGSRHCQRPEPTTESAYRPEEIT